jgi:hypothetical protein
MKNAIICLLVLICSVNLAFSADYFSFEDYYSLSEYIPMDTSRCDVGTREIQGQTYEDITNYELLWGYTPDSTFIWFETSNQSKESNVKVRFLIEVAELLPAWKYRAEMYGGWNYDELDQKPLYSSIHLLGISQKGGAWRWETPNGQIIEERVISPFYGLVGENVYSQIYLVLGGEFALSFHWSTNKEE